MITQFLKAYLEAYAASDFGDGPDFAQVTLTPELIVNIRRLKALCDGCGLSEVRIYASPNLWGPGDVDGDLRLNCAELVVTSSSFWFVDRPKHASYHIETRAVSIDEFLAVVDKPSSKAFFFGDDPAALEAAVIEAGLESDGESAYTTLCALMQVCDSAVIDGFEVDEFSGSDDLAGLMRSSNAPKLDGPFFRLEWCGGDESAVFAEQTVEFEEGATSFEITDVEGTTYSIEIFGERPHLVPSDVTLVKSPKESADECQ